MSKDYIAFGKEIDANARGLMEAAPEVMKAFGKSREAVYADGTLDAKTKELIACAVAVALHCDACVTHHVRLAHRKGVTREELVEALGVCLQLGGGPALAIGGEALAAYDQFAKG